MQKSTAGGSSFDDAREQGDREVVVGDADNVQKTSYIVGQGTDPDAPDPPEYAATVHADGASFWLWIVAALAVLIAVVYAFGLFS